MYCRVGRKTENLEDTLWRWEQWPDLGLILWGGNASQLCSPFWTLYLLSLQQPVTALMLTTKPAYVTSLASTGSTVMKFWQIGWQSKGSLQHPVHLETPTLSCPPGHPCLTCVPTGWPSYDCSWLPSLQASDDYSHMMAGQVIRCLTVARVKSLDANLVSFCPLHI